MAVGGGGLAFWTKFHKIPVFFSYTSVALRLAGLSRELLRYLASCLRYYILKSNNKLLLCVVLVESGLKWVSSCSTSTGSRTANSDVISYP